MPFGAVASRRAAVDQSLDAVLLLYGDLCTVTPQGGGLVVVLPTPATHFTARDMVCQSILV